MYPHMRLALELLRAAAAAGDPGAHGHMALRFAVGLDQGDCWTADGVARFAEVRVGRAEQDGKEGGGQSNRMQRCSGERGAERGPLEGGAQHCGARAGEEV